MVPFAATERPICGKASSPRIRSRGTWGRANSIWKCFRYYTAVRWLEPEGTRDGSTHMILTLGRERQEDHEFKAGLHWATLRDPVERRTEPQGIKGWWMPLCQEDLVGSNSQSVTIVYVSPCLSSINLEKTILHLVKYLICQPLQKTHSVNHQRKPITFKKKKATCSMSHQIHHYPPNHTLNQKPKG